MLYAADLVMIAESLKELEERYLASKKNMESNGLKVNIEKIKIIKSETNKGPVFTSSKYLCGVCKKGVGVNSVYYSFYSHWVHRRCGSLKGRLSDIPNFKHKKFLQ